MKSDLAIGFVQLAKITTLWQQHDVANSLKLSPEAAKQYLRGEGGDEQIARTYFQQLSERRTNDILLKLDKEQLALEQHKQHIDMLKGKIQLQRELTIRVKKVLKVVLSGVPRGVEGRKACIEYFGKLNEQISDPMVRDEMNETLFQVFGSDRKVVKKRKRK